jgi:hypothetical protein
MAERVLTFAPFDGDDRRQLNEMFAEGWETTMRLVRHDEEGEPVIFLMMERCDHCHPEGCEIDPEDEEDDDEYEKEKKRRMDEFNKRFPPKPPKDEDDPDKPF